MVVQVLIHADLIESKTHDQIKLMASSPAFQGLIAIMPDNHLGKGSCIGFTGKFNDLIIPQVIGVDIGCCVSAYPMGDDKIDFEKLDKEIRKNVPLGMNHRDTPSKFYKKHASDWLVKKIEKVSERINYKKSVECQVGTLGSGNHYVEVATDENGCNWLSVHTGSRNFGLSVCKYYQDKAKKLCDAMKVGVTRDLEYLPYNMGGKEYLEDMKVAQEFAKLNNKIIMLHILESLNITYSEKDLIFSAHNYIGDDKIIRKGAIQSYKNQEVIIPMNMAEGSIIGIGLGNAKYNFSAPHGAGRVHSRSAMKEKLRSGELTMDDFKDSMEGIFSTSIHERTIDESKFAYKQFADIEKHLKETVEIKHRLKPIYNLKA